MAEPWKPSAQVQRKIDAAKRVTGMLREQGRIASASAIDELIRSSMASGALNSRLTAELKKIRAEREAAFDALDLALPLLRDSAAALIEGDTKLDRSSAYPDQVMPRAGTLGEITRPTVEKLLAAVRFAEAVVGRPDDGVAHWLNDILDGRRAL